MKVPTSPSPSLSDLTKACYLTCGHIGHVRIAFISQGEPLAQCQIVRGCILCQMKSLSWDGRV